MRKMKDHIWYFLEDSDSRLATLFRWFIIVLILLSAFFAVTELLTFQIFLSQEWIASLDLFIIIIFTGEFLLRFLSAPKKGAFILNWYTIIDFIAIFPFYLGIQNLVLLRIFRLIRLLRLIKLGRKVRLANFFHFRNSIFAEVTPVVFLFLFAKIIIYFLEQNNFWFDLGNLDILFTIIGFALGVVLSNKIRNAYSKYLKLEDSLFELHGKLNSLSANLNIMAREKKLGKAGVRIVYEYLQDFLQLFSGEKEGAVRKLRKINRKLSESAAKIGNTNAIPFHRIAAMIQSIYEGSTFIMSKRVAFTPKEYDRFILHLIIFYLAMVCFFIPGIKGIVSIVFASYLLYGLYYLTNEFDYISGSDFQTGSANLITLDTSRLKHYLADLRREMKAKE